MGMDHQQMMGSTGLEPPPQFKEEPPENWQVSITSVTKTTHPYLNVQAQTHIDLSINLSNILNRFTTLYFCNKVMYIHIKIPNSKFPT